MTDAPTDAVIRSIRPALRDAQLTEEQRAEFLYKLVNEVYDYVKFDVYGHTVDAPERNRIAEVMQAALPRGRRQ